MTTAQVVECLGYPTRQCLERWLAMDPRYAGPYGQTHNSSGDKTEGDRTGAGRHAAEAGRQNSSVSVSAVHNWSQGVPQRRHSRVTAEPECRQGGNQRPSVLGAGRMPGAADDVEALRRRVEELELENALMRELVEVVKGSQAPTCGACRTGRKTMLIDRLRPRYSLRSMACLLRIAPSSYHYHQCQDRR